MSFREVFEVQSDGRASDCVEISCMGREGARNHREWSCELDITDKEVRQHGIETAAGSRSAFWQYDFDFSFIHDRRGNRRPNGHLNYIFPSRLVHAGRVSQGRIPAQGEGVVPSTHDGVTRLELE